MYLFFDASAAGTPKSWKAPVEDTFAWPRLVHLAWELVQPDSKIVEAKDYVIKPDGFTISEDSSNYHGVTQEEAMSEGHELSTVLKEFADVIDRAEHVISFNFNYNSKVVGAELIRTKQSSKLFVKPEFCLMQEATFYTKIMGKYGRYKWPTLPQLFQKIYGQRYEGANRAMMDVRATSMCFFYMIQRNVIELE